MSTLNYSCGKEPSQPRYNDIIIRGIFYYYFQINVRKMKGSIKIGRRRVINRAALATNLKMIFLRTPHLVHQNQQETRGD